MISIFQNIEVFTFFLARTTSFIFTLPVMGNQSVPVQSKVGFSMLVSLLLTSMYQHQVPGLVTDMLPFFLLIMKEAIVGLSLGFVTRFLFVGVQMAGELAGNQMGFGMSRVMDPSSAAQVSIISEFKTLVVTLFYLILNGHHMLMTGLAESYRLVPLGRVHYDTHIVRVVVSMAGGIFEAGVKIGAPIIISLLLANILLGVLARTVPQMNVFIVGLPLRIGIGFLALAATLSLFYHIFVVMWEQFEKDFWQFLKLLG